MILRDVLFSMLIQAEPLEGLLLEAGSGFRSGLITRMSRSAISLTISFLEDSAAMR